MARQSGTFVHGRQRHALLVILVTLLTLFIPVTAHAEDDNRTFFQQTNLVADQSGVAPATDPKLVNPWGLSVSPTGPWWVSDNGTGLSTLYDGSGHPAPLIVTIPSSSASPMGAKGTPTGTVFNGTTGFTVTKGSAAGPAVFLFATEDGTISGWNPKVAATDARIAVDRGNTGAVYKGLASATTRDGSFLYAANFHAGTVDVFDAHFQLVQQADAFRDPRLPAGYAPFGIQVLDNRLYVTYALQNAEKHDDVAGAGHGFVDVFDLNGRLRKRLVSQGALNSPWGLALAPEGFGQFHRALLVGNFGDGKIHAYHPESGELLGTLETASGKPVVIDGLWALAFGNGGQAGPTTTLFFTAGSDHEQHGLFGSLTVRPRKDD